MYYLRAPNKPVLHVEAQDDFLPRLSSSLGRCNEMNRSIFHDDDPPDFCEFKEDQLIPSQENRIREVISAMVRSCNDDKTIDHVGATLIP